MTGVDFVVIMSPDRTRWTHPDLTRVGKQFAGKWDSPVEREAFAREAAGTGRDDSVSLF